MADQTEAKMFIDLQFLINQTGTLGAAFTPPSPFAMPAAMQLKLDAASPLLSPFEQANAAESAKRRQRAELHKSLVPLCGDLIRYCESAGWSKAAIDKLKSFRRELNGKPAKGKEDDPATPDIDESKPKSSPSQNSYPSRTEHFSNFVETLRTDPNFNPTETPFKLTTLDALVDKLRQLNTEIAEVATAADVSRTALDAPLYTDAGNLVDSANSAIKYLSAVFKTHQVYHNVRHLKFKKPRRLNSTKG